MPHPDASDRLKDRIILVTGASEGVGRAVALGAARQGATLILCAEYEDSLDPVYDQIEAEGGAQPASLPLKLAKADKKLMLGIATTLADEFGRLDGLVHTATFVPYLSRIDDYGDADWDKVLEINLTAPFLLTQACLPLLRMSEDASVIFTADRVGRQGLAYWGAFAAAKFGIEGLMQTLAEELRDDSKIRVNSLDPGALRTAQRRQLYPGEDPNQLPTPDSVVPAYLRLLGPESAGITGQALSAADSPTDS